MMNDAVIATHVGEALEDLVALYLYGSRANGTTHAGSDLDLAVLARAPVDSLKLDALRLDLEDALRMDVDLVDLRRVSTVLRMQVVSQGRLLASRDDYERQRFENYVYASYARLNEERREILEQIRRTGRIHAR